MHRSSRHLLAAFVLLASARTLAAQTTRADTGAVIAAVEQLFGAMAKRDTASARALLLPGSRFIAMATDGAPAAPRIQGDSVFLRRLASDTTPLLERMWEPVVRFTGPLATVWTPYDFHVNGKWSHCGVDAVTLVRTGAAWRISEIAYTVQRQGCAPSPLGPPR